MREVLVRKQPCSSDLIYDGDLTGMKVYRSNLSTGPVVGRALQAQEAGRTPSGTTDTAAHPGGVRLVGREQTEADSEAGLPILRAACPRECL